jgi:hypothetical protein
VNISRVIFLHFPFTGVIHGFTVQNKLSLKNSQSTRNDNQNNTETTQDQC